ncbi:hypothetical protein G6O52_25010, partial [Salmonella enterica subsp. enterica serovar Heidelberg]
MLVNTLLQDDLPLARALLVRAAADPRSAFRSFVWGAMAQLLNLEPADGRRQIERFLERDADMAARGVAALGSLTRSFAAEDLRLLRRAVSSAELAVSRSALVALRWSKDLP